MKMLIHYLFEYAKEKKSRTILLILAICISGAMIYTMLDVKENLEEIYYDKLTYEMGNADIVITAKEDADDIFVQINQTKSEEIEYIHDVVEATAIYEYSEDRNKVIQLKGSSLADLKTGYKFEYASGSKKISELSENGVIISSTTSDKYNLNVGDKMNIFVGSIKKEFTVEVIAAPIGLFMDETQQMYAVVSFDTLSDLISLDGKANKIMIALKEEAEKEVVIEQLSKNYPDYMVVETMNQETINEEMSTLSMTLLFSAIMGSFMSLFIIYSSFKVIIVEQIPQIGTFRSIGATKGTVNKLILIQGFVYGVLGGVVGDLIGIGVSYLITKFSIPNNMKDIMEIEFTANWKYLMLSFVCAIVISLLGTMAPIKSVSKIPVKNIVLNILDTNKKMNLKRTIIYIPFFIAVVIFPKVTKGAMAGPLSLVFTILLYLTIVGMTPLFLQVIAGITKYMMRLIFGNIGRLSYINISSSKSSLNSTTLITIGVGIIIFMMVLSTGLTKVLVGAVEDIQTYDISIVAQGVGDQQASILDDTKTVSDYNFGYFVTDVKVKDSDRVISLIEGVKDIDYFDYRNIAIEDSTLVEELQHGNKIILTNTLKNRMDLSEGDSITLILNGKEVTFEVISFSDTYMTAGSFGMISMDNLQEIMEDDTYNSVYVNVTENENKNEVADYLAVKFDNKYATFEIVDDFVESFKDSMSQITIIIQCFAIMAVIVGFVGIVNNLLLNYIEKQHELAIFRSVGMSKVQMIQMLFAESFIIGLTGGISGVVCGVMQLNILPIMLQMVNVDLPLNVSFSTCCIFVCCAIAVSVLATVVVAIKSSKLNIVETIK